MSDTTISGFHAHIYFDETSIEAATALCKNAATNFGVKMGHVHQHPIGPHPLPSCQLTCLPQQFGNLLPWLMENRGDLIVFCHGQTGNHLEDHTRNTFWLGEEISLNLKMFAGN
jgi:DOPA 4,5-dioxygenase